MVLMLLVAFLGAAAKHSQFEPLPHHGYLAKAAKMGGVRCGQQVETEKITLTRICDAPAPSVAIECNVAIDVAEPGTPISLAAPPLRR